MAGYRSRVLDAQLDALMPAIAAIALDGAKAVGKTATASRRAATVFDLDRRRQRDLVLADPDRLLRAPLPVLIDEWQRVPELWDLVRRAVDDGANPASFLLTGSATAAGGTHSGAGRILRLRMRPLTLFERGFSSPTVSLTSLLAGGAASVEGSCDSYLEAYVDEIVRSGFPGIRVLTTLAREAQLDGYLERIVDRELPEVGRAVRNPGALRRWLSAYAAATSSTASYDAIRDATTPGEGSKPAKSTTIPYRDALERIWILDPLPAWLPTRNHLKQLGSAPKHHLADPALAVRLLGLDGDALLDGASVANRLQRDGTFLGALFESLVTLDVRVFAQAAGATVGHLRLHGGQHEVDLIVVRPDQRVVALEVKLSASVDEHDVRNLRWLRSAIGDDLLDAVIITTGAYAYRRPDGIAVVPAALLGP